MKTQQPHEELERNMRNNIFRDKDYTLHELYMLYQSIMQREGYYQKYSQMSEGSLERRAYDWPWLIRSGIGEEAKYAKRATHRSKMTCAQLKAKVKGWLLCGR